MLKFGIFLLAGMYSVFINNSFSADDCEHPYYSSSYAEFSARCEEYNASFQYSCANDAVTPNLGSAKLIVFPYSEDRVTLRCRFYSCTSGLVVDGVSSQVVFPINCLPKEDADDPSLPPPVITVVNNPNSCSRAGSIIETSNQVIGEKIPLVGVPFFLSHFSSRSTGRLGEYKITIPVSTMNVPGNVTGFNVIVSDDFNNIVSSYSLNKGPNQVLDYQWDGVENGVETWGSIKRNITIKTSVNSGVLVSDKSFYINVGALKSKKLGFGGWLPSIWRFYDSAAEKVYNGDGSSRNVKAVQEGVYSRVANDAGTEVYYFDSIGRIVYVKTGLTGAIVYSFQYRDDEKLASITDAYNKVIKFNYNQSGQIFEIVSSENVKTKLTIDSNENLVSITNPKNEIFRMAYKDRGGLLASFTKPDGNITRFTYDDLGNLLTDINSAGHSSLLSSTDKGINAISAMGRVTQNNYNKDDNSETQINPSGLSAKYTFSKNEDSVILPYANFKTTYGSDPRFGSQVKNAAKIESNNFGSTVTDIVDAVDLNDLTNPFSVNSLSKTITEGNSEFVSHYDGLTRTRTVTSKLGRSIAMQLDQFERPVLEQIGEFVPKKYQYQENLMTKMLQGERSLTFSYHPQTKLLQTIKNSEDQIVGFQYDEAQRLKSKTLPDGRVILYSYDSNGNLTGLTPPGRPVHKQVYGANEKLSSYNPPLLSGVANVNTTYTYNLDKELTKITRPDGKEINLNYGQASGLLDSISGSFGVINREYNQERLVKITDQNNQTMSLDYIGNTVSLLTLKDQNQHIVYEYQRSPLANSNGLVQSESITAGSKNQSIAYSYDDDKVLTQAGDLNLFFNAPNGSLKETNLQKIKEEYFYNQYGEVKGFRAFFVENNQKKLLYSYELERDKIGRIVKKTESFGKNEENRKHHRHSHYCRHHKDDKKIDSKYIYDKAGRLVRVKAEKRADSIYLYDKNSNRIAGVATGAPFVAIYDNQDRLIRFNNQIYSYNANGELLSKSKRIKNSYIDTGYNYDVFGGLKLAGNVTYQIDPLQRRSAKLVNNIVVRKYAYNPEGQLIAELDPQGNLLKTFVYASKSHVPDYFIDQNNELFKLVVDQLGSIRLVVKASTGEIVQKMNHDEFGKVLEDSYPGLTPFGFAGGLYDNDTKLIRLGARDYDSQTGRWTNKDPIMFDGNDTNLYGYVLQDPVNLIDPEGQEGRCATPGGCEMPISAMPIAGAGPAIGIGIGLDAYSKGGQQNVKDSGLAGLSDEEISKRARDRSLPPNERLRYQKEEKARGLRNKKKRECN